MKKIRVLVVDDSVFFRKVLTDNLKKDHRIEVIDTAIDAFDAEKKILELKPDVVTLDVEMPKKSGIDFVKEFIPKNPIPIVLVSSVNISVFDALQVGAVDFVRKPKSEFENFIRELINKIIIASVAKVKVSKIISNTFTKPILKKEEIKLNYMPGDRLKTVIALGASTGGTEATLEVIKDLPENTPPILIVQHMPEGFTKMYAQRLDKTCKMSVKEAEDGDLVKQGQIYIAPGNYQMSIQKRGESYYIKCTFGEKVSGHRPSVNVLFNSMASEVDINMVGIILTGMGSDGAEGLLKMRRKGAFTIGQDEASCVVYGMPMVAYKMGAVMKQVSNSDIGSVLLNHLRVNNW